MCSSRKYLIAYSAHRKDCKFLGGEGGGFLKTENFEEMYGVQVEFPGGWGFLQKSLLWERYMDLLQSYKMHFNSNH